MGEGTELVRSPQDDRRIERELGAMRRISEFLGDAIDAVKGSELTKQASDASRWLGAVGGALAEAVPLVKFAVKLFDKLTRKDDPEELGFLACSAAYQKSVEQALRAVGAPESPKTWTAEMRMALDALTPSSEITFSTLSFDDALAHPFAIEARRYVEGFADAVGYTPAERIKLVGEVQGRFVMNLMTLLSHGATREKYAPFRDRVSLGSTERRAAVALLEHANYQRALFEEAPVLGREPFALQHVYEDPECGLLSWADLKKGEKRIDPFSEHAGGREDLLATVFDFIGDRHFRDAIVVQGVAGSGKSAFTLRLCAALVDEGLRPIRVRLREVRFDKHISDALPQAVRFADEGKPLPPGASPPPEDLFRGRDIFKERVRFRGAEICPYILILDGWDEISVSTSEGFQNRVEKFLYEIRREYLDAWPVRVILTGRPATAVFESRFLLDKTPVLTLRPFRPEQVVRFVGRTKNALDERPVEVADAERWTIPEIERFDDVFDQYRKDFDALLGAAHEPRRPAQGASEIGPRLDVMGLPLLAHIALRLMSAWPGELSDLIANPTTLLRNLVDVTCHHGDLDPTDRARIAGEELRALLRKTAAAISARGEENIPHDELELRIGSQDVERDVARATSRRPLTDLMISFFFKGGHKDLGCEFVHKSFREYLFAEAIVETLKEYGRAVEWSLPERAVWWRDFDPTDPRHALARRLGRLLAPHWLEHDVSAHVVNLLEWELERSKTQEPVPATATTPLDLNGWIRVRDALADLWDWWSEGVHLRPLVERTRPTLQYGDTLADEMAVASLDAPRSHHHIPIPPRTTAIDAQLGDGLFQLAAAVHYLIAAETGWLRLQAQASSWVHPARARWESVTPMGRGPRRCQAGVGEWRLFSPAGPNPKFFANYAARINAAGWRPAGSFPTGVFMAGIDLRAAVVSIPSKRETRFGTDWSRANLTAAHLIGTFDSDAMYGVFAPVLVASTATFADADLAESHLQEAKLEGAVLSGTNLHGANLASARLAWARLDRAVLSSANLTGASLHQASLAGAFLNGTVARSADFDETNLRSAVFLQADVSHASFYNARAQGAHFDGAKTEGTNLPSDRDS